MHNALIFVQRHLFSEAKTFCICSLRKISKTRLLSVECLLEETQQYLRRDSLEIAGIPLTLHGIIFFQTPILLCKFSRRNLLLIMKHWNFKLEYRSFCQRVSSPTTSSPTYEVDSLTLNDIMSRVVFYFQFITH